MKENDYYGHYKIISPRLISQLGPAQFLDQIPEIVELISKDSLENIVDKYLEMKYTYKFKLKISCIGN